MTGFVDGGVGPHAFVDDLEHPVLDAGDHAHLARSLRLQVGSACTVTDGSGRWRQCEFGPEGEPLDVAGPVRESPPQTPPVGVGIALVKGSRPELAVQKLTELGVDHIWLFGATRSVVRWEPDRARRHRERLQRVAREAAMQSRRTTFPTLEVEVPWADLVGRPGAVLADRGGRPLGIDDRCVLIGPEGGWTDDERAEATGVVGLAPGVLRAETAAIVAGSLLVAARSRLVRLTTALGD